MGFPSFPYPLFHFLVLVSFLAWSIPKVPFLGISLLRNQTETLATQASLHVVKRLTGFELCATTPKNPQRRTTTCSGVCKRTQRATSNNVGRCWPTMLRPFARGNGRNIVGATKLGILRPFARGITDTNVTVWSKNNLQISKEKSRRNRIARLFLLTSSAPFLLPVLSG